MFRRLVGASFLAIALFASADFAAAAAGDDATLLRVFLKDGSSLVSYGEPALVGDRVVFSMPTAAVPNPPLHLVSLARARVDWDRTLRYAAAARMQHYLANRAEADYAALSSDVAQVLNEVALTADPVARLGIIERARKALAAWPQNHYDYRQADVRRMLSMLDEAIADLRAATGAQRFDLSFTASVEPPTIAEPLLPPPTARDSIQEVLLAARVVDSAAERTSLLTSAVAAMDRDKASLPVDWLAARRIEAQAAILAERRVDRSYRTLTARMMTQATQRMRLGDVKGLQRLLGGIERRDAALGAKRPEAVAALVAAVEEKLDAARRFQLARERWALRAPALYAYRTAIATPVDIFTGLKPSLENIKELAGSTPASLSAIERASTQILKLASAIAPPEEVAAAHALLISAVQLAANAGQIRREAALAGDMSRAWDASSAAAGALMLFTRARTDMQALFRAPQIR